jgi:hypothetical protein
MLPFPVPSGFSTPTPSTPEGVPLPEPTAPQASPVPTAEPSVALVVPQTVITPPPVPSPTPKPTPKPTPRPTVRPKPAIATHFTNAYYDHGRQALVLGYTGAVPAYGVVPGAGRSLTLEFPKTALVKKTTLMQVFSHHPLLTRWTAKDVAASGLVRIGFDTVAPGEVLVAVDAPHHQLLVLPQLQDKLELPPDMPTGVATTFGRAYFDAAVGAVVVPYKGATPIYAIEPVGPAYVYLDFVNASVEPAGIQFESLPHGSALDFWLLARRPGKPMARLAINLPQPGFVRVLDDKANLRLLLVPAPQSAAPGGPGA